MSYTWQSEPHGLARESSQDVPFLQEFCKEKLEELEVELEDREEIELD